MKRLVILLGCTLCACGDTSKAPQPVNIVGDTYCAAGERRSWDVADTRETIDGIRRGNAGYNKRCPK